MDDVIICIPKLFLYPSMFNFGFCLRAEGGALLFQIFVRVDILRLSFLCGFVFILKPA